MKQVYCISGLGADERVFSRLSPADTQFRYLEWIVPENKEPIEHYAARMATQIHHNHPILMGVSFGGMMAIEIARVIPAAKVILVSSVKSHHELPQWMKLSGRLRLNKLMPPRPAEWMSLLENTFLGAESEEEIALCDEFRKNVNPAYLRWAIEQIVNWRNEWQSPVTYHIHGNKDKIFPLKSILPTHVIKGGGHFMIMNRAPAISALLNKIL
ncbi:MAG: alpha/beta hydrolase [Puia sp.]|nr:alpha/beta hydrolase [Puia sp.]